MPRDPVVQVSVEKLTMRAERNIDAIADEVKEMRHALKVFASNPRKYEPQLENLAQAAVNTMRSARAILRSIGVSEDD